MKTILAISLSLIATAGVSLNAQTVTVRNNHGSSKICVEIIGSNTIIRGSHDMESMGPAIRTRLTVAPGKTDSIELKVISKINFPDIKEASQSIRYTYGPKAYSGAQDAVHEYTFTQDSTIVRGLK